MFSALAMPNFRQREVNAVTRSSVRPNRRETSAHFATCTLSPRGVFYCLIARINSPHRSSRRAIRHFQRRNGHQSEKGRSEPMNKEAYTKPHNMDEFEVQEWLESLDSVLESSGPEVATEILERLRAHATVSGIDLPFTANTPYAHTVPLRLEPDFPGDQ